MGFREDFAKVANNVREQAGIYFQRNRNRTRPGIVSPQRVGETGLFPNRGPAAGESRPSGDPRPQPLRFPVGELGPEGGRGGTPRIEPPGYNLFAEISIVDTRRSTGTYTWPFNPDELVGRRGIRVYDRMRIDDQVRAALTIKKFAVLSTGWRLNAPSQSPIDREATHFIKYVFDSLEGAFEEDLYEIMSGLDYGFSTTEKVYTLYDSGPFKGKIGLRALKTIAPHDINFVTDEHGNLLEISQLQRPMPPDKFAVFSNIMEFGNWYGTSDLRAAYRPWWIKDNALRYLSIYLEKFALPLPIASIPLGISSTDQQNLKNVLQNLQSATTAILSDQIKLEFPKIPTGGADALLGAIDGLNLGIARSILLPNLLGLTTMSRVGSLARARKDFELFIVVVDQLRLVLAATVLTEQIIRPLVKMNYPDAGVPQFQFQPLTEEQRRELLKVWLDAVRFQAIVPTPEDEAYFRHMVGLPHVPQSRVISGGPQLRRRPGPQSTEPVEEEAPGGTGIPTGGIPGMPSPVPGVTSIFSRKPDSTAEQRVHFQEVQYALDTLESEFVKRLSDIFVGMRDQLVGWVKSRFKSRFDLDGVEKVQLRGIDSLQRTMREMLQTNFRLGRRNVGQEVRITKSFSWDLTPDQALEYLDQKAITSSGLVRDEILGEVKQILLEALRMGENPNDTVVKLESLFTPYISSSPEGPVPRSRLLTLVRTTNTEAYNEGRKSMMSDPDVKSFLKAVRYSAVIDDRTTPVCRFLDGHYFQPGSSDLDRFTPPNHWNCRSILVPVLLTDPEDIEMISPSDLGKAKELGGKGFV